MVVCHPPQVFSHLERITFKVRGTTFDLPKCFVVLSKHNFTDFVENSSFHRILEHLKVNSIRSRIRLIHLSFSLDQ